MSDVYFIIIPIVAVVVVLKLCLIFWRVWIYQKRREQQARLYQERRVPCRATARVVAVRRVSGPGGIAQQTSYAIEQPGCPTRQVTRTIIVRPASGRPNDPNLPPSYDQAVTGADRSVKVEDGQDLPYPPPSHVQSSQAPSAPPAANLPYPPPPPPHDPHLPPPPAYGPPTPSAPTLEDSDEIPASDTQRLLA